MDGLFSGKQETSHLGSLKWMTCFLVLPFLCTFLNEI